MKKTILALSFLFATISTIFAQDININTVFMSMPDKIIFGLEAEHKDKLLSKANDTSNVVIRGTLYTNMERLAFSDNYISIRTSDAANVQIKLLPLVNDSKIICVVKTVCGKVCDSQIQFYTTKWIPIEQSDIFPAKNIDWFVKESNLLADNNVQTTSDEDDNRTIQTINDFDMVQKIVKNDMQPIKVSLSADNDDISVEYNVKNYLTTNDYKAVEPYLKKKPIMFAWDKTSYKYKE